SSLKDALMRSRFRLILLVLIGSLAPLDAAETGGGGIYRLEEFGPLSTPAEVRQTWQAAREAMRDKAAVVVVPANVWTQLKPDSLQGTVRTPMPPAETKQWRVGAGTTVVTADRENTVLHVPPLSGLTIDRELRLNE